MIAKKVQIYRDYIDGKILQLFEYPQEIAQDVLSEGAGDWSTLKQKKDNYPLGDYVANSQSLGIATGGFIGFILVRALAMHWGIGSPRADGFGFAAVVGAAIVNAGYLGVWSSRHSHRLLWVQTSPLLKRTSTRIAITSSVIGGAMIGCDLLLSLIPIP